MPNTRSGSTFEKMVEAGLISVGLEKADSNDSFAEFVMRPKRCMHPTYMTQFAMRDESKISGKQMLDFAIIIPVRKPITRYSMRSNRICIGVECRWQNSPGTVDRKNISTIDDLCGWSRFLPHARLVLGGKHWTGDGGKRQIDELTHRCGMLAVRGTTVRVLKIAEFTNEISVLTGRKWKVDDAVLAVLHGRADKRQISLF